jgi:tRNA-uridine 2-sulfurtransferase
MGLPVHDKTESQDICFVEGGDYRDVLARARPGLGRSGNVVTNSGTVLGEHAGVINYTVGQRAGVPPSNDGPRYVTRIDAATNTIVIGREDELLSHDLVADELNLIRPERLAESDTPVRAMIRYRAEPAPAVATVTPDRRLHLRFERAQRAVTPGQLVAILGSTDDEVLGAATIALH